MAEQFRCIYRGKVAEQCVHRRVKRRKVQQQNLPGLIYLCRDPDRVARPEKCYRRPSVKGCEGYKTAEEVRGEK